MYRRTEYPVLIRPTRYTNFSNLFFGIKLYMFRTVPLSIIRSFSLYTQQWYMSYRFADSLRSAGSGRLISQIYFWNKTLHVSDSSSVHHQEFFTVHIVVVYVIQLASRIRTDHPDPADRKLSANLYDIYHCCVYSEKLLMMDRGTVRNM